MALVDVKHAWFDESIFPSLHAINPSADLSPHSRLPDFSGVSALPFDTDDKDNPSPDKDQPMASPAPSNHTTEEDVDMDIPADGKEPTTPQEAPPAAPRCLILRLGPHPIRISSTIDSSNILNR
ncbi:hypothetical protein PCASD_25082 [Puccinia coronata f. sp. avenae]|uniref:Uncharacterized protein n=1 Tax=Puccinia coronata f. sp. avenae TaxID=200324 RepID=A0A2N5TUX0_9BASI|nr:hypothetical protein PCASD_25082 [Puccinia coronata f. sp. avenae]